MRRSIGAYMEGKAGSVQPTYPNSISIWIHSTNGRTEIGATAQGKRNDRPDARDYRRNHPVKRRAPLSRTDIPLRENVAQTNSRMLSIPCGRLLSCEMLRRLLIDQRHLHQLYVDRQTEPPVELIKLCCFPTGEHFSEDGHVFQS
jgi:hypothetical protein